MRVSALPSPQDPVGRETGLPRWRPALIVCGAIAVLSLALHRTPDFDPTAWLIWGRQLADGTLSTTGGPSWKPLPVMVTTPLALLGDTAAAWLWLVVARAGGLLALVACFRVATRLGGRTAGAIATAGLALATGFLYNAGRGDAEGLLVLLALLAVEAHLTGRRRVALIAAAGAGLIRPELWPLLGLYGAWLLVRDRRPGTVLVVAAVPIALLGLWFIPEHVGSGEWLRAATRAQQPAPGSPGQSSLPFLRTFAEAAVVLAWPLYAGALAAVVAAARARPRTDRDRTVLALAAGATLHMLLVASMAEAGFTGNMRYATLPAALLCVLAGIGLPGLYDRVRRQAARRLAVGLALAAVAVSLGLIVYDTHRLAVEQRVYGTQLAELIDRAGGRRALLACGPVGANHFARQMVAWRLDLLQSDIELGTSRAAGTVLARAGTGAAASPHLPERIRLGEWELRSRCPLGS